MIFANGQMTLKTTGVAEYQAAGVAEYQATRVTGFHGLGGSTRMRPDALLDAVGEAYEGLTR